MSAPTPAFSGELRESLTVRLNKQLDRFQRAIEDIRIALKILELMPDIDLERVSTTIVALGRLPKD